jgi:hypothetical protein
MGSPENEALKFCWERVRRAAEPLGTRLTRVFAKYQLRMLSIANCSSKIFAPENCFKFSLFKEDHMVLFGR